MSVLSMLIRGYGTAAILALCSLSMLFAQEDPRPIIIGEQFTLKSELLGEDRNIIVIKPQGYDNGSQRYPVMYVLDGDAHFHHVSGLNEYLAGLRRMPQMLLVGISNTDRTRDLTPETSTDADGRFPTAGGANRFLEFIESELMPNIEKTYRTHPYRVLVGHSFGGLFAINALFTKPDIFDAYFAISPSLWWNDGSMVTLAGNFLDANPALDKFLYFTLANEGGDMLVRNRELEALLEKRSPDGLIWGFTLMENETHGSIPHRTIYAGLEALFKDWAMPRELANSGSLEAFDAHYAALSKRFKFDITTPEGQINLLGYRHIRNEEHNEAIRVLQENTKRFPQSANVYDSLGDAYDAAGKTKKARDSYRKAVEHAMKTGNRNLGIYQANLARVEAELKK